MKSAVPLARTPLDRRAARGARGWIFCVTSLLCLLIGLLGRRGRGRRGGWRRGRRDHCALAPEVEVGCAAMVAQLVEH
jgi:hypothetical protein